MQGKSRLPFPQRTVWRNLILLFALFLNFSLQASPTQHFIDKFFPATTFAGNLFAAADLGDFASGQDAGATTAAPAAEQSISMSESDIYVSLAVLLMSLIVIVLLLVFIVANLMNLMRVREGKQAYSFAGTMALSLRLMKNRYFALFGNFVLIIVAVTFLTKKARGVGLHQGYMPEQPIKFSHPTHAAKLKIDCQYCHNTASKSKNASIPSVNVCWNCHKVVKDGPKTGTVEIAKIEDAMRKNKPIEWVRVHNIPDHAYFNHQQHVVVAGVECQTCHGKIEEMEEVYQFAPLSMGWCINCHRETEVKKDVYRDLGIFKDLMSKDKKKVTAEDIGATNCARCHY